MMYGGTRAFQLRDCCCHNTRSPATILKNGSTNRVPSTKFTTSSTTLIFSVSTTDISKSPSRLWIRSTSDCSRPACARSCLPTTGGIAKGRVNHRKKRRCLLTMSNQPSAMSQSAWLSTNSGSKR